MNRLIGETYMKYPTTKSKKKVRFGIYQCSKCPNTFEAQTYQVKIGHSTSCGCKVGFQKGNIPANKSIYDTNSHLYTKWESMKGRCYTKGNSMYNYYGGRGITVCKEWLEDFGSFKLWAEANGYAKTKHIHRIDNDKEYSPTNCVFIDASEHIRHHNIERQSHLPMLIKRSIK